MADDRDKELAKLRAELDSRTNVAQPEDPRDAEIARLRAELAGASASEPPNTGPVSREEYDKLRAEMDDVIRKFSQTTMVPGGGTEGGAPQPFHHHLSDGRVVAGDGHATLWSEILDGVETLTPVIASYVRKVA